MRHPHNNRRRIKVGPHCHPEMPHTWSWIYFHQQAEDMNSAFVDECVEGRVMDWQAPDLVGCDTPVNCISDGTLIRLEHLNGQELWAMLWSAEAEYQWDENQEIGMWTARRRGLVICPGDDKAYEYARKCYDERRSHL